MTIDDWGRLFTLAATSCGVLVVIGSLLSSRRGAEEWAMIIGAVLATLGMGLTVLILFDLNDGFQRHSIFFGLGSTCLGAMVFAMGFLVNELRYRAAVRHRAQLDLMEAGNEGIHVERPGCHD